MRPGSCWGLREALPGELPWGRAGISCPQGADWLYRRLDGFWGLRREGCGSQSVQWVPFISFSETGDIYIWGWNESGQLALPTRSLAEDGKTVAKEGEGQFFHTFLSFLTPGHMLA